MVTLNVRPNLLSSPRIEWGMSNSRQLTMRLVFASMLFTTIGAAYADEVVGRIEILELQSNVFGNTRKVGKHWQADAHLVSALMTSYWTNFAITGDPNAQGLPAWQPYDVENHSTQLLRPDAHTVAGVRREKLDLWDRRFATD